MMRRRQRWSDGRGRQSWIRLDDEKIKANGGRCDRAFDASKSPASRLPNEAFSRSKINAANSPSSRGASVCYWRLARQQRREQGLIPQWNVRSSTQDLLGQSVILHLVVASADKVFSARSVGARQVGHAPMIGQPPDLQLRD
jgi:hypothetical protein